MREYGISLSVGVLVAGVMAVVAAQPVFAQDSVFTVDTTAETEFFTPDFGLQDNVRELEGPKRTVAVDRVNSTGSFAAFFGDWDQGGGMEAIMMDALVQSGQFEVVDRAAIDAALAQQQMTESGMTAGGTGPRAGRLKAAQLLVIGSITQVDLDTKGTDVNIGVGIGRMGQAGVGAAFRSGTLVMDVRLVDTETSQIINTFSARQKVKDRSTSVDVTYDVVSFGTTSFWKTPLGDAMRELIGNLTQQIVAASQGVPWSAKVIDFSDGRLFINSGARSGLQVGDEFAVKRVARVFTDPDTGEVLSTRYKELGTVNIIVVEDRMAEGLYVPVSTMAPELGDMVTMD